MHRNEPSSFDMITARPLAKRLGVSLWTLNEWVAKGKFPPPLVVVPGSPRRWQVKVIEDWVAKMRRHPGNRYMRPDWARAVRDQCARAGVPFLLGQMSGRKTNPRRDADNRREQDHGDEARC